MTLPPLPEWSLRDDLGELVPSEIRVALRKYATAAVLAEREAWVKACLESVWSDEHKGINLPVARIRARSEP